MNTIEKEAQVMGGTTVLKVIFLNDLPVKDGAVPVEFCCIMERTSDWMRHLDETVEGVINPDRIFTNMAKEVFQEVFGFELASYQLGLFETRHKGLHLHGIAYINGEGLNDRVKEIRLEIVGQSLTKICEEAGITIEA